MTDLMQEEIERLRDRVIALAATNSSKDLKIVQLADEIARLRNSDTYYMQEEIERLRAALREIKDIAFNRASSEVAGNFDACAYNIAKAALEDEDERQD